MSFIKGAEFEAPAREPFKMPTLEEMMAMFGGPGDGGPGGPGGPDGGPGGPGGGPGGPGGPPGMGGTPKTATVLIADGKVELAPNGGCLTGEVTPTGAKGIKITCEGPDVGGITVDGEGQVFTLEDSTITVSGSGSGLGGRASGVYSVNHSDFTLKNCRLTSTGAARCCTSTEQYSTMRIYDSLLIGHGAPYGEDAPKLEGFMMSPPAALEIEGNARTHCTQSNAETYFYNSTIIADGWAAVSTDGAEGYVYLECNDCSVVTTKSGYGAYADGACHDVFNRTNFDVACMAGIIAGEADMTFNDCHSKCGTYFALIHCVMGQPSEVSELTVNGGTISTQKPVVLVKSQNTEIVFDGVRAESACGILLKTQWNDDPNATKTNGKTVYGVRLTLRNEDYEGDIVHEDPDRDVFVTLENASLTGSINKGILTLKGGAQWFATGDSSVTLTGFVHEGQIDAAEGVTITAVADSAGTYPLPSGGTLVTVTA